MIDLQRYTGNNHLIGMSCGNEPVLIRDRGNEWLMEWHYYFGPAILNKRTHSPLAKQPGEKSRFWMVAVWWKDQGAKVVDGIAIWKEPPIVTERFRRVNKSNFVADANGEVVRRHYEGYEQFGEPK